MDYQNEMDAGYYLLLSRNKFLLVAVSPSVKDTGTYQTCCNM